MMSGKTLNSTKVIVTNYLGSDQITFDIVSDFLQVISVAPIIYKLIKKTKETLERFSHVKHFSMMFSNADIYVGARYPQYGDIHKYAEPDQESARNFYSLLNKIFGTKISYLNSLDNQLSPGRNIVANGGFSSDLSLVLMGYDLKTLAFDSKKRIGINLPYRFDFGVGEASARNARIKHPYLEDVSVVGENGKPLKTPDNRPTVSVWGPKKSLDFSILTHVPIKINNKISSAWLPAGCKGDGEVAISLLYRDALKHAIRPQTGFGKKGSIFDYINDELIYASTEYFQLVIEHAIQKDDRAKVKNYQARPVAFCPLEKCAPIDIERLFPKV